MINAPVDLVGEVATRMPFTQNCMLCRWKDKDNSTCSAFLQPEYVLVDTSNMPVPRAPAPQTGGSAGRDNREEGASAAEAE